MSDLQENRDLELQESQDSAIPDGTVRLPSLDEVSFFTQEQNGNGLDIPPLSEIPVPDVLAGAAGSGKESAEEPQEAPETEEVSFPEESFPEEEPQDMQQDEPVPQVTEQPVPPMTEQPLPQDVPPQVHQPGQPYVKPVLQEQPYIPAAEPYPPQMNQPVPPYVQPMQPQMNQPGAPAAAPYPTQTPAAGGVFSSPVDAVAAAQAAAYAGQMQSPAPEEEYEEEYYDDAASEGYDGYGTNRRPAPAKREDYGYNGYPVRQKRHSSKKRGLSDRVVRTRVLLPAVLLAAAVLTALFAATARRREEAAQENTEALMEQIPGMQAVELKLNAYEDLNELITTYYNAYADSDTATISALTEGLTEEDLIRIRATGDHILSYPLIDVYSKDGPSEGTYVVYAYTEEILNGYDAAIPGMTTMFAASRDDGSLYIKAQLPADVLSYVQLVTIQDDVVDLNNRVAAKYNEMLASDPELEEYIDVVTEDIRIQAARMLAGEDVSPGAGQQAAEEEQPETEEAVEEQPEEQPEEAAQEEEQAEETPVQPIPAGSKARVLEAVNLRSSASIDSDSITMLYGGDEVEVVEDAGNGWSKVTYDGETGYIKTEFIEEVD